MKKSFPIVLFIIGCFSIVLLESCFKDLGSEIPTKKNSSDTLSFDYQVREFLVSAGMDSGGYDYDSVLVDLPDGSTVFYYYYVIDTVIGGKTQAEGNVLSIHYGEYLLDNTVIYPYDTTAMPLVVAQGIDAIYPIGVDIAIAGMREGETWGFIFPPELGYGKLDLGTYAGFIPPESILHFKINLAKIRNLFNEVIPQEVSAISQYVEDTQLNDTAVWKGSFVLYPPDAPGLVYKLIGDTLSGARPAPGSVVSVTYDLFYLDSSFYDLSHRNTNFVFSIGQTDRGIIPGLEFGVQLMRQGERALIIMPSGLAYRESAVVLPDFITSEIIDHEIVPDYVADIDPYRPLVFDIILRNVQ